MFPTTSKLKKKKLSYFQKPYNWSYTLINKNIEYVLL
jgi:hypothetical protein